jgi:hypothetical protein
MPGKDRSFQVSDRAFHRVRSACFCLLAVLLLYAPYAGAVISVQLLDCCTGDFCPLQHHHHNSSHADSGSQMDCDHSMNEVTGCSMSCCRNPEKPAVTAIAFVMPYRVFSSATIGTSPAAEAADVVILHHTVQPLAPPPRLA